MCSLAGALILSVTYGIDVLPENDPYIASAERGMKAVSEAGNTGGFLGTFPKLSAVECPC